MGDHKQLNDREAVDKLKEIVKHQGVCMMITNLKGDPVNTRPMGVSEVDEDGNLWFMTLSTSRKYKDLEKEPRVDLHFMNPSSQEFLSVHGTAEFSNDLAKKKKLWNPIATAWVPDGVEDPNLRLIKVHPENAYYWDSKNGKVVAAFKIAMAAITHGANDDGGVEGRLKV